MLRMMLWLVEKRLGRALLANRILTWYPKAFIGSGIMEALIAHDEPEVPRRLLALIRIYTSFIVSCPFCIDMNAKDFDRKGITDQEIRALQRQASAARGAPVGQIRTSVSRGSLPSTLLDEVSTLSARDKAALRYAECICRTPLMFTSDVIAEMREHFSERGMVIVASTCAQVNFWARLIQSLGVPPAGFSSECAVLNLDAYATRQADREP